MCINVTEVVKSWRPYSRQFGEDGDEEGLCPDCHGEMCDNCRSFLETGLSAHCSDGSCATFLYRTKRFYVTLDSVTSGWMLIDGKWCIANKAKEVKLDPISYYDFLNQNGKYAMEVIWAMNNAMPGFIDMLRAI